MSNKRLQETYQEIQEMKKKRKGIKSMWKDELEHHARYQEIMEEMGELKEEKKKIEHELREANAADIREVDELTVEIKSSEELLSDLAFNMYLKDQTVEVTDEYKNRYVPQFVVKFKKDGTIAED
jgi:uncharacterized coiled-coil DUF342 family protein